MDGKEAFAGCLSRTSGGSLCLVGLPDDTHSSYRRGSAQAPERIRSVYHSQAYNATTETGIDLTACIEDGGDWKPEASWELTCRAYREGVRKLLRRRQIGFFLGGDHAVTVPLVDALQDLGRPLWVIQLDAHPDLYPSYREDPFSHACTASRILEMKHVRGLIQIGIRTLNSPQRRQLIRHADRVQLYPANACTDRLPDLPQIDRRDPVYLSLDMDVFDPPYVPGVAHPVPGGLTPRQVLNWLQESHWTWAGMDVVEVNPSLDLRDLTSLLAARLLHEAMGRASLRHVFKEGLE